MGQHIIGDQARFREVLGHYPTGVVVVTCRDERGEPIGMTIGSFSSVSADPPLVSFLPMRTSHTFERMRGCDTFCVNILAGDQEDLCRQFASGAHDFANVKWSSSPQGAPILDGAVGWIECTTHSIRDAGDHYLVLGQVDNLAVSRPVQPLVFFQGGYGRFAPQSLVALPERDLISGVRLAEAVHSELDALGASLGAEASLMAPVGEDLVVVGATAAPGHSVAPSLGSRVPLRPPLGELYVAWQDDKRVDEWLAQIHPRDEATRATYRERLTAARRRGWAMSMMTDPSEDALYLDLRAYRSTDLTPERAREIESRIAEATRAYEPVDIVDGRRYDIRSIVAPVLGVRGDLQMVLRVSELPKDVGKDEVLAWIEALTDAAGRLGTASSAGPTCDERSSSTVG